MDPVTIGAVAAGAGTLFQGLGSIFGRQPDMSSRSSTSVHAPTDVKIDTRTDSSVRSSTVQSSITLDATSLWAGFFTLAAVSLVGLFTLSRR